MRYDNVTVWSVMIARVTYECKLGGGEAGAFTLLQARQVQAAGADVHSVQESRNVDAHSKRKERLEIYRIVYVALLLFT